MVEMIFSSQAETETNGGEKTRPGISEIMHGKILQYRLTIKAICSLLFLLCSKISGREPPLQTANIFCQSRAQLWAGV